LLIVTLGVGAHQSFRAGFIAYGRKFGRAPAELPRQTSPWLAFGVQPDVRAKAISSLGLAAIPVLPEPFLSSAVGLYIGSPFSRRSRLFAKLASRGAWFRSATPPYWRLIIAPPDVQGFADGRRRREGGEAFARGLPALAGRLIAEKPRSLA